MNEPLPEAGAAAVPSPAATSEGPPARDGKLALRIVDRRMEAPDIVSLTLRAADGSSLPPADPGAHLVLDLPSGLARTYSLCGDPGQREFYRLGVLREAASRGGSVEMHALNPGDVLTSSLPRNGFPLVETSARTLLLAGGIGVTPLMSMAYRLKTIGARFELHYCARSARRAAFRAELQRDFPAALHLHFDDGPAAQRFDAPALLRRCAPGDQLYVCGPQGFIDHVLKCATAAGWPDTALHKEYFSATVDVAGGEFTVRLARSGRTVRVGAEQSIAQALAAEGIFVPLSCEQGVCGTCVTAVLDGYPDHRDSYLTDEERAANDQITVCCSRSNSAELVLDL